MRCDAGIALGYFIVTPIIIDKHNNNGVPKPRVLSARLGGSYLGIYIAF